MRRPSLAIAVALSAACTSAENAPAADSPAAAPSLSLASLAGKWSQVAMPENSDSVLVTSEVNVSADGMAWTLTLPDRAPIPMTVTVDGDSVMTNVGPYESVLRKGVTVTTTGVSRLQDGKLVGRTTAHYSAGPDSVRQLRTVGTRVP